MTSTSLNSVPYTIRRADLHDLTSLVMLRIEFLEEVNGESTPAGLQQSLEKYFAAALKAGDFIAWLATTNEQIVGTSGLVFMQRPPSFSNLSGRDAYIMNMYTLPSWRGRGIGTALFRQLLEYIRASGSGKAFLHATEQGQRLYEKFGFHVDNEEVEMSLTIPPGNSGRDLL